MFPKRTMISAVCNGSLACVVAHSEAKTQTVAGHLGPNERTVRMPEAGKDYSRPGVLKATTGGAQFSLGDQPAERGRHLGHAEKLRCVVCRRLEMAPSKRAEITRRAANHSGQPCAGTASFSLTAPSAGPWPASCVCTR
jgi:hypothetical protein